jgi:CubicO group peptidase (beta-lactamase class C family)
LNKATAIQFFFTKQIFAPVICNPIMLRGVLLLNTYYLWASDEISAQSIKDRIDSLILKKFSDKNGPGGVFMVARQGKTIYQKAFGKANLELGVYIAEKDIYVLGFSNCDCNSPTQLPRDLAALLVKS